VGAVVLRERGPAGVAPGGFTLIEVVIAMAIGLVVMLANLFLFGTASRDLAASRALTDATNLATGKIADFRAMSLPEIVAAAPSVDPSPNPLEVRRGTETVAAGGTTFTRAWAVSLADLGGDGAPDLVGELLRIRVEVSWSVAGRGHSVSMATFTTGKSP